MKEIIPRGISGDDLVHQLNIALETREKIFEAANDGADIHLDLSSAEWFTPSFLVPISVVYNRVREKDVDISVSTPPNYQTRSYLDQICFPEGTPEPENTYTNQIPLCLMNTDLDEDVIEVVGDEISKILKKQFSDVMDSGGIDWIKIPITEMIDNVDYHSYCDYGAVLTVLGNPADFRNFSRSS